ncbi:hypothetical protein [Curtobacterium sp. MCSS17_016]|uniref:hypothetical protein n=1 Tax=Curtobacterium sp. MCSS17_016 TaxID=2175644 RepID=UPI0011B782ED|nr:hypothetical protein [Curtobacterium sp. MCSS17_016]WIE80995.1 hypothetical protein DEJ19_020985 [Curtobacterium sp. MCSS17_016]
MTVMLMAARCRACDEEHLLTRDGTMTVHNRGDGTRCPGSVGLNRPAPRRSASVPRRERPSSTTERTRGGGEPRHTVRLDQNHPPYAKQRLTCPECGFTVPATIYGRYSPHRVHNPDAVGKKAMNKARRGCPGSGRPIPDKQLAFTPAAPPEPAPPTPEPAEPVKVSCHSCFAVTTRLAGGKYAAHQRPTGGWCPAGRPPTPEERAKGKPKPKGRGSVWTTSAGLPSLGRHR